MESSNPIGALTIVGVLIYALLVIVAGVLLAIILRFFLKKDGPLVEFAEISGPPMAYAIAAGTVAISAILVFLAIQLLEQLFGSSLGSTTRFLVGITTTGVVTLSMYYKLDSFCRRWTRLPR